MKWLFKRPGEKNFTIFRLIRLSLKNLAADPAYAEIKTTLQSQLDGWVKQQGDKGMETENLASTRQGKSDEEPRKGKAKGKGKKKAK